MSNHKLFNEIEPSERLFNDIIGHVEFKNRQTARIKFSLLSATALAALTSIIPVFSYAANEFSQSGVYHYASLVFSDTNLVLVYWKDFLYLIAESFPFIGITAFLGAVLVFFGSVKLALKNAGSVHFRAFNQN